VEGEEKEQRKRIGKKQVRKGKGGKDEKEGRRKRSVST